MTDVEGVVDEVVVGEGDTLRVARRSRGELDKCKRGTSMNAQNIFKPHYGALQDRVWKTQYFWSSLNLDVAGVVHPDLVGQLGHHLGRDGAGAAHHLLEPDHCHQHTAHNLDQFFFQCSLSKFLATLVALLHFTPVSHLVGRQVVVSN